MYVELVFDELFAEWWTRRGAAGLGRGSPMPDRAVGVAGQNASTARRASGSRTPQLMSSSVRSDGDLSYMTASERRSSWRMESTRPL